VKLPIGDYGVLDINRTEGEEMQTKYLQRNLLKTHLEDEEDGDNINMNVVQRDMED
jgi:hypothetical protein